MWQGRGANSWSPDLQWDPLLTVLSGPADTAATTRTAKLKQLTLRRGVGGGQTLLRRDYYEFDTIKLLNGQRQAKLVLIAYASSEGSGEPAHPRSLARTSAARSYKLWAKRNLQTESQIPSPSEWVGMRR